MKRPYIESLTIAPPKGGASSSPYDGEGLFVGEPHNELNNLWAKVGWPERDELAFLERFAQHEGDR